MRKGIQHRLRPGLLALPLALAMTACGTTGGMGSGPPPALSGTQWNIVEIDGKRPLGTDLTTQFSVDGRVSGNSGCNQYSGAYIQTDAKVRFGELLSTRRACVDADRQRQETRVLDILKGETTVRQERREIRISGNGGALILTPAS